MTDLTVPAAPDAAPAAHHVAPQALAVLDHLGFLCRVLLDGSTTGGAFGLVQERGRLGATTPRHVHAREAETFLVTDGAIEGWCEGTSTLVEAGQLIHLPAGREHAFRVASAEAAFYTLITPAGFERFFRESGRVVTAPFDGELPTPRPPTPEQAAALAATAAGHDCTVLGPPPFPPH